MSCDHEDVPRVTIRVEEKGICVYRYITLVHLEMKTLDGSGVQYICVTYFQVQNNRYPQLSSGGFLEQASRTSSLRSNSAVREEGSVSG